MDGAMNAQCVGCVRRTNRLRSATSISWCSSRRAFPRLSRSSGSWVSPIPEGSCKQSPGASQTALRLCGASAVRGVVGIDIGRANLAGGLKRENRVLLHMSTQITHDHWRDISVIRMFDSQLIFQR